MSYGLKEREEVMGTWKDWAEAGSDQKIAGIRAPKAEGSKSDFAGNRTALLGTALRYYFTSPKNLLVLSLLIS